ncbi:hypothetical protein EIP86_000812 [Pleurotus ostreatoroseus]|nr:hypothetical protein EIP86_000812 [Pleurotus ostreatoroseus]
MLKRQRGSSPIPYPVEPTQEADVGATDLYEPDVKRRRYFAPVHDGSWRSDEGGDSADGDSADEAESLNREWGRGRERPRDIGEYGKANRLLHDLHAEQRHRMLFTPSAHPMHPPLQYQHHYAEHHPLAPYAYAYHPGAKSDPPPAVEYPLRNLTVTSTAAKHELRADGSMFQERKATEEAASVSQRYEDTNRCVTIRVRRCIWN